MIWGLLIYVFIFLLNLGGLFWVQYFVFENFEIVFWIRFPTFGGVCFIKLFDLRPLYICFFIFWNFRGSFLSLIFGFLKILKLYFESEFPFLGGFVYKTFLFEASLYMFWFFGTLGGLFWVWILVFENFEIVFWIRIPTFGGVCFTKLVDLRPSW